MHLTRKYVTAWYSCDWLLCVQRFLPQATAVTGYHIILLQVVCQKRMPQIDSLFQRILQILCQQNIMRSRLLQGTDIISNFVSGFYIPKDFTMSYCG